MGTSKLPVHEEHDLVIIYYEHAEGPMTYAVGWIVFRDETVIELASSLEENNTLEMVAECSQELQISHIHEIRTIAGKTAPSIENFC